MSPKCTFLCFYQVIKALLDKGANRTVKDNQGRTALLIAEANEHQAAVTALTPTTQVNHTEVRHAVCVN